jgi:DNA-binding CsgD family transcriptional regulator
MNRILRSFYLALGFHFGSLGGIAQDQPSVDASELLKYATPFIQHYSKKEYQAGNKNWSLAQDDAGFIYAGNSNGLLQFDGIRWTRFNFPGSTIIRSVFADGDRIYSGSLGEFGYWEKDEHFNLHYHSISEQIKDNDFGDQEIWWITKYKGKIYFQSFSKTYFYDGDKVEILFRNIGVIFPPFVVHNRMFIQALDRGIYEITQEGPVLMSGSGVFKGKKVQMMLPISDEEGILIGTEQNGLYILQNGYFNYWNISANRILNLQQINRGIKISDDLIAIGTILGGLYILDEDGNILKQINKKNGLNNNTVLSLLIDNKKNLWAGLDNGIDLIKVNSPLYYNFDLWGNIGSVYTIAIHQGYLYLGTNRGVFYQEIDEKSGLVNQEFKLIEGSQGQIWNLSVIDGTLFCGHNTFTYIIENQRLKKISDISGGYIFKPYPYDDSQIFSGAYNGLFVYKKDGGSWEYSHWVKGFSKLSKNFEIERENIFWVSDAYRGLYRLELNNDLTEVIEVRSYSMDSKTYISKVNNTPIFSTDSGFVYYDDIQHSFNPLKDINNELADFSKNAQMIPAGENTYWIFKDGQCIKAVIDENEILEINKASLDDLSGYLIPGHENIYMMNEKLILITLDNGFAIFNNAWKDSKSDYQPNLYLRQLTFLNSNGEPIHGVINARDVPYRYNNVVAKLSYPKYDNEIRLEYKLEGYNDRWIPVNDLNNLSFQNLPHGSYSVKVKAKNSVAAEVLSFSFFINPPWYRTNLAFVLYFIGISSIIVFFIYRNKMKIRKIHKQHALERKMLLEKEAAENERKLIEIRNENLRNEIKLRNSRLAKSTFSLIHKNNSLISVKSEIVKIKKELGKRFPSKYFNRIIRGIDQGLTSEKDWHMFEQSFSEVHENFLQKLKEEYPELTPSDIQLCAYLKMNLSSKEIASLLNITLRGVEIRRYRLRKKLKMTHDTNLTEFIMSY